MTPGDIGDAARLYELIAKVFGAGAAPAVMALWIYLNSKKKPEDSGASLVSELRDDMKATREDVAAMKIKIAVIETKLEERKE